MENEVNKAAEVVVKVEACRDKIDDLVEKALDKSGNHPWNDWMDRFLRQAARFLPIFVVISGLTATIVSVIAACSRRSASLGEMMFCLTYLVLTVFSAHLSPKALLLTRTMLTKREPDMIRPELIYIMKVAYGLGSLALALALLLTFTSGLVALAIPLAVFGVIMIIVLSRPELVGVKADYPTNVVEEFIALLMFPIKVVLAFLPFIVICLSLGLFGSGLGMAFRGGYSMYKATIPLLQATLCPFVVPMLAYFLYLMLTFALDFYRAIVSIPRKLDELAKATKE